MPFPASDQVCTLGDLAQHRGHVSRRQRTLYVAAIDVGEGDGGLAFPCPGRQHRHRLRLQHGRGEDYVDRGSDVRNSNPFLRQVADAARAELVVARGETLDPVLAVGIGDGTMSGVLDAKVHPFQGLAATGIDDAAGEGVLGVGCLNEYGNKQS